MPDKPAIQASWTHSELVEMLRKTLVAGIDVDEEAFTRTLYSYSHAEDLEEEIRKASEEILTKHFRQWSVYKLKSD
jgi:hypothetical protein